MTNPFSQQHPFLRRQLERVIGISVGWFTVMVLIFFTLLTLGFMSGGLLPQSGGQYRFVYGNGDHELLSIKVDGTITGEASDNGSPLANLSDSQTSGYAVKDQLRAAADNGYIEGVILEINSPGGTIYGARAIADGVAYYKAKTHNPVYAHISGQGDSGAYWAAISADKVIADYGSDIGSIGVVMGPFEYYDKPIAENNGIFSGGIVTQNGIESTTITAGTSKDVGNPFRKLTDAEIKTLQQSVNNEYDDFVSAVSQARRIPADTIRNQIGAMSYDNKTALQYKLIDQTASRDTTYEELANAAHIQGKNFTIVAQHQKQSFVGSLVSAVTHKPQTQASSHLCTLTRTSLAYHGDVSALCSSSSDN